MNGAALRPAHESARRAPGRRAADPVYHGARRGPPARRPRAAATGAQLGGRLYDLFHKDDLVWVAALGLALLAAVLALMIGGPAATRRHAALAEA
jgi:hypothetical protein